MARTIAVTESIDVDVTPAELWDFTQDYARRSSWDATVLESEVLALAPLPRVRVRARGGLSAVFQYRLFDRPSRTSLAMEDVVSPWFEGGGGSWSYEARGSGTRWTQTNALVLKPGWWRALFAPAVRAVLRSSTRRAMRRAKALVQHEAQ